MRPKSFILLILALGCGLIAAVGINQVLANRGSKVVVQNGETESIFVVMTDMQPGQKLSPEVLKLEPWPKDKVPAGAITELANVEGRRTRTRLYSGEPILEAKLFNSNSVDNEATILIPKGFRVESVKVDAVAGGSNLIVPGDRIDVMVFLQKNPTKNIDVTITRTILQNIQVFAINDKFKMEKGEAEEGSIQAKTVSLLVTPEDAQLLHLASELGEIRLSLRSPEDEEIVVTQTTPASQLTNAQGNSNSDDESLFATGSPIVDTPEETNEPAPLDESLIAHRMFVIEGPEMWEQVFDYDGRPLKEAPDEQPRARSRDDSLLPDAVDEEELNNDFDGEEMDNELDGEDVANDLDGEGLVNDLDENEDVDGDLDEED